MVIRLFVSLSFAAHGCISMESSVSEHTNPPWVAFLLHDCCIHRPSQAAALLPWHPSALMFPYSPVVVWRNAGWSPDGGWDGSLSRTGMKSSDLRYAAVTAACYRLLLRFFLDSRVCVTSVDPSGFGETEPAYSGCL